jgi:hypothetical protein
VLDPVPPDRRVEQCPAGQVVRRAEKADRARVHGEAPLVGHMRVADQDQIRFTDMEAGLGERIVALLRLQGRPRHGLAWQSAGAHSLCGGLIGCVVACLVAARSGAVAASDRVRARRSGFLARRESFDTLRRKGRRARLLEYYSPAPLSISVQIYER